MRYDRFALLTFFVCMLGVSTVAMAQDTPVPGATFDVTIEDAQEAVGNALVAEGVADRISATITSTRQKALYHGQQPLNVEVKTLKFDEAAKSFSANLIFLNGVDVLSAMPISGRYDASVEVPVLTRALRNGDVIQESDIAYKQLPASRVRSGSITDVAQLIGATPRRAVSGNRPIREDEVQAPAMVKKGGVVQMTYQTPFMTVQTMGEAMEDGSEGARIRVKNQDSHTVVYATVRSEGEVVVGPVAQLASVDKNSTTPQQNLPGANINGRQTR